MPLDKVIPVRVAVRCRPLIQKEIGEGCQLCVNFTPDEPQIVVGRDRAFTYDFVFSPTNYQNEVYDNSVKPLLNSFFKGYNATVLAYGQTGSGKTFTMGGCYEASLSQDEDQMGVIPRVLRELFQGIEERVDSTFKVSVSYLEIHKEDLHDLLCHPSKRDNLAIREETSGGITITGLTETEVKNFEDTMKCLTQGSAGRTTGSTAMNNTSSRSHAIFTITVERTKIDDPEDSCKAKFHLVDLAGSERVKRTHAEGERLREGININRGLLALGNVISALGDDTQKRSHIPYRDSKLTRLLQDSLGGNSHTLMVACISPADSNMEETINTLRYADRARKIKNKPIVNRDPQQMEIMRLKNLVQQLQVQLIQGGPGDLTVTVKQGSSPVTSTQDYKNLIEKNRVLEEENAKLTRELQMSVDQNTTNLERAIKLELSRDKLRAKLKEFKSHTGVDFELLGQSIDIESNPLMKEELEKLRQLAENVRTDSEEEKSDELIEDGLEPEVDLDAEPLPSTPDSRAISKQHVLKQAQMNRELQELNRLLAKKEELANQMANNDSKMEEMKMQYELSMKELESEVSILQKERENLHQALHDAKVNSVANKISEQRRKRLQECESQISKLKKKMSEQSKMIKLKDQSDKQVLKLNTDIQSMKQQRVKLMRQIKEDAENFRKWKQQKDKEVLQLQLKDRKRQCEMQKMQKVHEKQQNVLRRKAEEAAAANKRLKDALTKHKTVLAERNKQLEKCDNTSIGNRVRSWLSHELDVRVSIREAKYHLDSLLADRKTLTATLTDLKEKLEDGPPSKRMAWTNSEGSTEDVSFEEDGIKDEIKALETEIELRNIQISDLQQKIVDADQESKGKSAWESLHTMMEAKCALKWLMEQAVSSKADTHITRSELKEAQAASEDTTQSHQKMEEDIAKLKQSYESQMTKLQREHESKILFLLQKINSQSGDANKSTDKDTRERLEFQEKTIDSLSELSDKLQQATEENEGLKKQLTRVMYQGKQMALMPSISEPGSSPFLTPVPKPKRQTKAKVKKPEVVEDVDESTDFDSDDYEYDNPNDEDWTRTPLYCRKRQQKKPINKEKKDSQSSFNSTFSLEDEKSKSTEDTPIVPEVKPKHGRQSRKIFQAIDTQDNLLRSSDEFEKPRATRSRLSKRGSDSSAADDSGNSSFLDGGLKKKRKLLTNRSSLFTPLA